MSTLFIQHQYHIRAFQQIAESLHGYTKRCIISFVDTYAKNQKNLNALQQSQLGIEELKHFANTLSKIALANDMQISTCAEQIDLSEYGITHSCCIDKSDIENVIGYKIQAKKDKNQRKECGCVESVEVGAYNTCKNGCKYCYANYSIESVVKNCKNYNAHSPLLCDTIKENDSITERKIKTLKINQLSLLES